MQLSITLPYDSPGLF